MVSGGFDTDPSIIDNSCESCAEKQGRSMADRHGRIFDFRGLFGGNLPQDRAMRKNRRVSAARKCTSSVNETDRGYPERELCDNFDNRSIQDPGCIGR